VTDGAGAIVLASEGFAERRNLEPLGTIVAHAKVAEEPLNLHTVPGNAGKLALEKAGWTADDLDLVEINEAFAAVAINSTRMLGVSEEIVNVNGGAVSLGHPIGASGARILMTLLYELKRRGGGKGLAAICSGGGQGDAVLVEV
jgi:acetyl-CoA C-acetyltransferase